MARRLGGAVAAGALLLGGWTAPASAAARAADEEPRLTAASLSTSEVRLNGMELAKVTVTVTLTGLPDPVNVISLGWTGRGRRPEGNIPTSRPRLVSGTEKDGTWQSVAVVPSPAHGSWHIDAVSDEGDVGYSWWLTPEKSGLPDPVLTVHGTHRPHVTMTASPDPAPVGTRWVRTTVRVTDERGRPFARQPISFESGTGCRYGARASHRTDRDGRLVTTVNPGAFVPFLAASVAMPPGLPLEPNDSGCYAFGFASVEMGSAVTATLTGRPRPHGRSRLVAGTVRTALGQDSFVFDGVSVELQRRDGRHWRTVATGRVADDGSFRVRVTPTRRGTASYRVRYPGTRDDFRPVLPSVSRVLLIKAT